MDSYKIFIVLMLQYGLMEAKLVDIHLGSERETAEIESMTRQIEEGKASKTIESETATEEEKAAAWQKLYDIGRAT